jgi:Rieske Fe-S protein
MDLSTSASTSTANAAVSAIETRRTASTDRRTVLRAAGLTGAACAAGVCLTACGGSSSSTGAAAQSTTAAAGGGSATTPAQSGSGTLLGATSQIPVGGGMIFASQKVVVTQPTAGTYKAFSSTCTHMGCQVNQVTGGLIECPCHGSHYSIVDGSVKAGPAPLPLPAEPITVKSGQIFLTA